MRKTRIEIDGMMCGMCEAHINEAIRKHFRASKVKASRTAKEAVILSEESIDEEQLKRVIRETGYTPGAVVTEDGVKRRLFGF